MNARPEDCATDPLLALLDALYHERLLAWAVEHAPDGDGDATVARAWRASVHPHLMALVLAYAGREAGPLNSVWSLACGEDCGPCVSRPGCPHTSLQSGMAGCCAPCVARIAAEVSAPAFAALLAGARAEAGR